MTVKRAAFDRAIAAWNHGDLEGYLDLYDEGIRLHGYSDPPVSKSEAAAFYRGIFVALSDLVLEIHEVVEDGEQLDADSRCTEHRLVSSPASRRPAAASRNPA